MRVMQALRDRALIRRQAIAELNQIAGEEVVRALSDLRRIVSVNDNIAFAAESYDRLVAEIQAPHQRHPARSTPRPCETSLAASRKYAIAVLEHLDSLGITQRVGDVRKRGRNL